MMTENVGGVPSVITGGDSAMGGNWVWAFLLFALLGRGGFGGYGGGEVANVDNTVWASQNFARLEGGHNSISSQISALGQGICDSTYALNNSIKDGSYGTAMAIQDSKYALGNGICNSTYELSTAIRDCCCTTERAIDGVNFNAERNTNAIVQAGNANTQRILDFLTCNELKEAQTKIFEQGQALSEARIIGAMKPQAPIPAYTVPSPYVSYNGCC